MKKLFFSLALAVLSTLNSSLSLATPSSTDVVIVGAGLSGLASAYYLKKEGYKVHIIEINPRVGGRVKTAHYEFMGQKLAADAGMEEYWESNPAVGLLKELKLNTRSDVAISSVIIDGKLEPLGDEDRPDYLKKVMTPEGYQQFLGLEEKLKPLVTEVETGKISPETMKLKDISMAEWAKTLNLPHKVSEWIRVTVECEIGTEWDQISALDGVEELKIFIGEGEKCYRVNGGNEKFTAAIAKAVGTENISLNKRVTRVITRGDKVTVGYIDNATSVSKEITASHVIVTIPLFRLQMELNFDPPLSEKKREAIASQTYGSYFKPHIFVKPSASKYWTVNGNSVLPILTDSELGVIYDGNPDQEGKIKILSLLITGASANEFNFGPIDDSRKRVTAALSKLWPGIEKDILGMEFQRYHPRAIAAWPPGRSRFDALSEEIRKPENRVYLAGDFTETSHSNGAFISAQRAVRQIKTADLAHGVTGKKSKTNQKKLGQE